MGLSSLVTMHKSAFKRCYFKTVLVQGLTEQAIKGSYIRVLAMAEGKRYGMIIEEAMNKKIFKVGLVSLPILQAYLSRVTQNAYLPSCWMTHKYVQ